MKIRKILITTCLILSMFMLASVFPIGDSKNMGTVEAASKPGKVTGMSYSRYSKSKVKLSWNKVSGAKGYAVYMRTNSGSYKKIATTSSNKYMVSNLKVGNTYYYKVCAYKTERGKKKYGSYSNILKRKLPAYEYMTDIGLEPYSGLYNWYDRLNASFSMASTSYGKGLTICTPTSWTGPVCFNLKGKFSTMKFTYGGVDGDDGDYTLSFYGDGELIATISHSEYSLPQEAEIDVKDVYQLVIEKVENNCTAGIANVKMYY